MSKPPALPPRAASPTVPIRTSSEGESSRPALPPRRPSTSQVSTATTSSTAPYGGYAPSPTVSAPSTTAAAPPKLPPRAPSVPAPVATTTQPNPVSPPLPVRRMATPPPPTSTEPTQPTYLHSTGPSPRSSLSLSKNSGPPALPPSINRASQPQHQAPQMPPQQQSGQSYATSNPFAPQAAYGNAPPIPSTSSSYEPSSTHTTPSSGPPKLPSRNSMNFQQSAPSLGFAHPDVSNIQTSATLAKILEATLAKLGCPGIAIVVVKQGKIIDRGALGLRKAGSNVPVTVNDKWHIGSCSKSFTGTLAGKMVSQGKISWNTTIAQVFPELVSTMNPAYQNVTLAQLFQHRGGIPSTLTTNWTRQGRTLGQQRAEVVAATLATKPQVTPGHEHYSNSSTTIAAAMLERVDGRNKTWEELNLEEVCLPLGLSSVGYGVPAKDDVSSTSPDQPWGHKRSAPTAPYQPNNGDNPAVIAPAALVHITADDFARYLIAHVEGHNGKFAEVMSKEEWRAVHTPPAGSSPHYYSHAIGWLATESMLTHDGSNLSWWCRMWASTKTKDALVICTNGEMVPSDVAESIASDIRKHLLGWTF